MIGVAVAWYLGAAVQAFLFRIEPTDLRAFGAAIGVLGASAIAAVIVPARRAATVDPLTSLRTP